MPTYQSIAGITAGILAVVAFAPYIVGILQRKTHPNRASFAIWSAISVLSAASYLASGAHDSAWITLSYAVLEPTVLLLALRYGVGGFSKLDVLCLASAGAGVVLWLTTHNPHLALYASIIAECIGYIPTIKKSYLWPSSENKASWVIGLAGTIVNLTAISGFDPAIWSYPVAIFLADGAIVALLLFPKWRPFAINATARSPHIT